MKVRIINSAYRVEYVCKTRSEKWAHLIEEMVRDGSGKWNSDIAFIENEQAAKLLLEHGKDPADYAGLEDWAIDD